ncbi:hypothetical protein [Sporolactobacillus sp. THM19-2]|jgi:hypothetical protein|uniref:hypothetical protein n=1 Tax=Sporolactobacillus sp. THM19-2 TaxID=2511171 RepID=UPI00101F5562|nr:hypothetical protein [Sporolactobacillus sp. THM19-2]RYL91509.1 hypothetical protein EWH91_09090 [Sporolactobacillus sp. THM19-2]
MSLQDDLIMMTGILLIIAGIVLILKKRKCTLPSRLKRRLRLPSRFFATLGIILLLAGTALIISPLLIVNMGLDFWIVFFLGVFACLMLLIMFFL